MNKHEPIRILHYIKHLESGGGETFLFNLYKNIDRNLVQFDFLVNSEKEEKLDKKIDLLGGKKIVLIKKEPKFTPMKIFFVIKALRKLFREENYEQFHIHCSNGQGLLFAYIAKISGVPIRITHIHNSDINGRFKLLKKLFHYTCKHLFMSAPNVYFACSRKAAYWLYTKKIVDECKYVLLKNGIETEKYIFNPDIRMNVRNELGLNDYKVIIHIGRMEKEKNQAFLLDIFKEICLLSDGYKMIIVGQGSLESEIKDYAESIGVNNRIIFLDYTNEVEKLLFAADVFLLPSLSEGLGIVAIEAQATGLPTVVSDRIPEEAYISDLIKSISLKDNAMLWARNIIDIQDNKDRANAINAVKKEGYDIKDSAAYLQDFYLQQYHKKQEFI